MRNLLTQKYRFGLEAWVKDKLLLGERWKDSEVDKQCLVSFLSGVMGQIEDVEVLGGVAKVVDELLCLPDNKLHGIRAVVNLRAQAKKLASSSPSAGFELGDDPTFRNLSGLVGIYVAGGVNAGDEDLRFRKEFESFVFASGMHGRDSNSLRKGILNSGVVSSLLLDDTEAEGGGLINKICLYKLLKLCANKSVLMSANVGVEEEKEIGRKVKLVYGNLEVDEREEIEEGVLEVSERAKYCGKPCRH